MRHRLALAVVRLILVVSGAYLLAPYAADDWWPFLLGAFLLVMGAFTIGYEFHADRVTSLEVRLLRLQIIDMRESIEARREREDDE